jgi:hypothetical protein
MLGRSQTRVYICYHSTLPYRIYLNYFNVNLYGFFYVYYLYYIVLYGIQVLIKNLHSNIIFLNFETVGTIFHRC